MKKVVYGGLFLALIGIGFSSCKKEDLGNTVVNQGSGIGKNHIPTFESMEDLNDRLELLSKMSEEERRTYENETNAKSLLTKVYEVYEGIDLENLTSQSELQNYVDLHSSTLELRTDRNKEYEYRPYFSDNEYSIVANEDRLVVVGETCIKIFDDGIVTTDKANISLLSDINEVSVENILPTDELFVSKISTEEIITRAACNPTYNEDLSLIHI